MKVRIALYGHLNGESMSEEALLKILNKLTCEYDLVSLIETAFLVSTSFQLPF